MVDENRISELSEKEGRRRLQIAHLQMEPVLEDRIEAEKQASARVGIEWKQFYEANCTNCGRPYESEFLSPPGGEGVCIPCWRKEQRLPKVGEDVTNEELEELKR